MKLIGYIKEKKENSFPVPVYANAQGDYFFHTIDNRHNLVSFVTATFSDSSLQQLYLSKKFTVGSKSAIVFIGKEGYLHYNSAPTAIEEIIHYLNDHVAKYNINAILDETMLLKNRILSDHFVVDSFVVKMDPKDDQITLSFDFPSPKKEASKVGNSEMETMESNATTKVRNLTIDQQSDPAFKNAIKQLNSVDMNFEVKLKLRAEERRSKLKIFNYQFKLNQNTSKKQKPFD